MSDLRIQEVILRLIALLRPELEAIERRDPDLGRQMRRAAASMSLNTSEGAYSRGRTKKVRYHSALGSARETFGCLETAVAFGHIGRIREEVRASFNQVLGTLTNLAR